MKKLFGKSNAEEPKSATPTVDQRVDIMIRGLGRSGGTVEEVTPESVIIGLIFDPTKGEQPPSEPEAIIEYTGLRGMYRQKGSARFDVNGGKKVRFLSSEEPELLQRRQFVRVPVNTSVGVSVKSGGWPLDCDVINLSGNGLLIGPPQSGTSLDVGTVVWLSIPLYDGEEPITPSGMVVRDAGKGLRGIRFDHIGERDQQRLVRFVMRQEREQRKKGNL
jgi:PilZ domain